MDVRLFCSVLNPYGICVEVLYDYTSLLLWEQRYISRKGVSLVPRNCFLVCRTWKKLFDFRCSRLWSNYKLSLHDKGIFLGYVTRANLQLRYSFTVTIKCAYTDCHRNVFYGISERCLYLTDTGLLHNCVTFLDIYCIFSICFLSSLSAHVSHRVMIQW